MATDGVSEENSTANHGFGFGSNRRGDDPSNPYFLSNSDSPGMILVSQQLIGSENFNTWEISMKVALDSKTKFGFVCGEILMPAENNSFYCSWKRVNSMLISWLLNSVTKEIASSIIYMKTSHEIWKDLKERFSEKNNPRIFQLKKAICGLNQEQLSVNAYFTRLKTLWEEYIDYNRIPHCSNGISCAALKMMLEFQQKEYTMQFLMGLNDNYANLRSQILLLDPLPPINRVFATVIQEERQRSICPLIHPVVEPTAFVSKTESNGNFGNVGFKNGYKKDKLAVCTHCGLQGHTVDKCYRVHGFPPGFKFKNGNVVNKNGNQGHQSFGNSGYGNSGNQRYGGGFGHQAASVQGQLGQDGYQVQPSSDFQSSQNQGSFDDEQAPVTQGQFQQLLALVNNQLSMLNSSTTQNTSQSQNVFSANACSPFIPHSHPNTGAAGYHSHFSPPQNRAYGSISNHPSTSKQVIHTLPGPHPMDDDWTG